jgi:UDP-N-acetylglucosamine 2-epimerase
MIFKFICQCVNLKNNLYKMLRQRILIILGTRPEAIKFAPVIKELARYPRQFEYQVCATGQHKEMVQQALEAFELSADIQLDAMLAGHSLAALTAKLFNDIDEVIQHEKPDWVIVQGDTTSAMVGAICAFYRKIKIAHIEAGLRTNNRWAPFPEEINRVFVGHIADFHFAPTAQAAENLRQQGIAEKNIKVTGNTVVDALLWTRDKVRNCQPAEISSNVLKSLNNKRLILVTSHRRESFGEGLKNICQALKEITHSYRDVLIIYPVHLNPNVQHVVYAKLNEQPQILLMKPLSYRSLVYLMDRSFLILTDSGGIQEEAPSLGKPVLIMRERTERPEVIEAGCAKLVGTSFSKIVDTTIELLENPTLYQTMSQVKNPFGDGMAASKIVQTLICESNC